MGNDGSGVRFVPVDCGRGNHDWSDEPLEDGSFYCENAACAMFLFPEFGAVAPNRQSAKQFADHRPETTDE